MSQDFVDDCLETLAAADDARYGEVLRALQPTFVDHPREAACLVRRIVELPGDAAIEHPLALLTGALDEARMADENGRPEGRALFAAVEEELARLADEGLLPPALRLGLAQAWVHAGLDPPAAVTLDEAAIAAEGAAAGDAAMPDLGALVEQVRAASGGEPSQLHAGLVDLLAAFPAPMRAVAVAAICERPEGNVARLGAYWLLDRAAEVRAAAAGVALARARDGRLEDTERARLMAVRKWLPADEARGLVDQALREAMRRGADAAARPPAWRLHRLVASLPDGTGAQHVAVAAQAGGRRATALALVKPGHGVKDAFVMPANSAAEQRRLVGEVAAQTGAVEVDAAFARGLLARALGDGEAAGVLPAPGLVDVAEILGGDDLAPAPPDTERLLADLDPDGTLAALSPQKRGRLVNASADWPERYPMIESWFEDSGAVREILDAPGPPQRRRAALKRHLDDRRAWWAAIIARAAATVKAGGPEAGDWTTFWATARALEEGREIDQTPIMRAVVDRTLDAADARYAEAEVGGWDDEAEQEGEDGAEEPLLGADGSPVANERPGEFERLVAGSDRTPAWIEGWLVALAVAPDPISPAAWIRPLFEGVSFESQADAQRFVELLSLRAYAVDAMTADATTMKARLAVYTSDERRQWAAGFRALTVFVPKAWGKRGPKKDDARVIALIAEAATGTLDDSHLALVSDWLARRHAERR